MNDQSELILKSVQAKVEEEEALQLRSAQYRNVVRQLFETVASKVEHVISELLQNADDAGARCAQIRIVGDDFLFKHDGKDFDQDQFEALCSFAVSSKHTIKTTGFRGIGFKSTFSLGDSVYLTTPCFQVRFDRDRFTYPNGLPEVKPDSVWTVSIRVPISKKAKRELESSLREWKRSPCSLLFFQNLQDGIIIDGERFSVKLSLEVGDQYLIKKDDWMVPVWKGRKISKKGIILPEDACNEIAQLRGAESEVVSTDLDIVISEQERGRIYSILPTSGDKKLSVSFAVNGAFVLTPDRDGIKSPSQSPTNRCLFEEVGRTVAQNLITALDNKGDFNRELIEAYQLLPLGLELENPDAETEASHLIFEACLEELKGKKWILTLDGRRISPDREELVELPEKLTNVWSSFELHELFCPNKTIIHPKIPQSVIAHLDEQRKIETFTTPGLLDSLTEQEPPRPKTIEQLFTLWEWAQKSIIPKEYTLDSEIEKHRHLNILPALGETKLKALNDVYRFNGETAALFSENKIDLVELGIYRLDTAFVPAESFRATSPPVAWWRLMESDYVGITKVSSPESLLNRARKEAVNKSDPSKSLATLKTFWTIFWNLDLRLPEFFPILRQNGDLLPKNKQQILLESEETESGTKLIPEDYLKCCAISKDWLPAEEEGRKYFEEWALRNDIGAYFPKPIKKSRKGSLMDVLLFARSCGSTIAANLKGTYHINEAKWDSILAKHWDEAYEKTPDIYWYILIQTIENNKEFSDSEKFVKLSRTYGNTSNSLETRPPIPAAWVRYFYDKPCVPNQDGTLTRPSGLFVSNASTLPIVAAGEPSVNAEYESYVGPNLLSALGCRTSLPSLSEIGQLLESTLDSGSDNFDRVLQLLLAANTQFVSSVSEEERSEFLDAISRKASIPSAKRTLEKPDDLVQETSEEGEDAIAVHPKLKGTPIIGALAIPQSANRQAHIDWLESELPIDEPLATDQLRKLQKILKHPSSISEHLWINLRCWITLDGTVRSIDDLEYVHSKDSDLPKGKIVCDATKQETADFTIMSPIPPEMLSSKPELVQQLEPSLKCSHNAKQAKPEWLPAIAKLAWTEAEGSEQSKEEFESFARAISDARLILDPNLSQQFKFVDRIIADGIQIRAAWDEANLSVRTDDEDELCELASDIARCIREKLPSHSKLRSKIESWVEQPANRIVNRGLKALGIERIRPWPDEPITEAPASGAHQESESPTPEPRPNPIEARPITNQLENIGSKSDYSQPSSEGEPYSRSTSGPQLPSNPETTGMDGDSSISPRGQSRNRMLSYVEPAENREQRERRRSQAKAAGDAAEKSVVSWERDQGRIPIHLGGNNPGYDIESKSEANDSMRYIEVKSVAGEWGGEGVRLSNTQFEFARRLRDQYWLYVVEFAKSDEPIIHAIQDPFGHVSNFCIDHNWKEIAETTDSKRQAFVPEVGQEVLYEDQVVTVEKVEKRGVFYAVSFRRDGKLYKMMNTLFSPKD